MTESEKTLRILLRIRNIRVKKQLAALKASETNLNSKLNEHVSLTQKIEDDREAHSRQQREHTQKLLNKQSTESSPDATVGSQADSTTVSTAAESDPASTDSKPTE